MTKHVEDKIEKNELMPKSQDARTKMDVHKETLTMEFDGEVITFNMNDAIKYPSEEHSVFSVDVINPIVQ